MPSLPAVAAKVAHDMRGAIGILRTVLGELGLEGADGEVQLDGVARDRLLQMAARATGKLERTANHLDALAHRQAKAAADVDLEPMVLAAATRTAQLERKGDVPLTLPTASRPTRVRVVAAGLGPALEDVFRWALRQRTEGVRGSTAVVERAVVFTLQVEGVTAVPAAVVPFEEPLGLAAFLLEEMGASLTVRPDDGGVTIVMTLPAGGPP